MKPDAIDFAAIFGRLAAEGLREQTTPLGGVDARLVRVAANYAGEWDHHDHSTETVVVWSGDFKVEFRDGAVQLGPGQCCVVPAGADHRAASRSGAEIVLFQNSPL
jgi:mannose-6-phosphate isomerase-like protein (cupin superfamily)